jgi:hypothetical protein
MGAAGTHGTYVRSRTDVLASERAHFVLLLDDRGAGIHRQPK